MRISKKQRIVKNLRSKFERSDVFILTDYKRLNVESMNSLRQQLRKIESEFQVAKNSLLIRAAIGNQVELIKDEFVGPSAVAFTNNNPLAIAKVLTKFSSDNPNFKIKIGVLGGKVISVGDINALASLPPKKILLAHLLSSIAALPISLVTVLNKIPSGIVNVLQALKDQKDT